MDNNGAFSPKSILATSPEPVMDLDFMDDLLYEGCWIETSDGINFMQPGPSTKISSDYQMNHEETELKFPQFPVNPQIVDLPRIQSQNMEAVGACASLVQPGSFLVEDTELGSRWWIGPRSEPDPSSSVRNRLMQVVGCLKERTKDREVLIQIWVPVKRGDKHVLTTEDQPYSLKTNCESLQRYRDVSKNYNFPVEEDSKESAGMPGRVYLGKLPEWTPDVRFFKSYEYPRINFARQYDVSGSLALPVFERGSGTCLGVVELVTTARKINYRPELEDVCKALEAVDLRSSENFSPPSVEVSYGSYQVALPEITAILGSICKTHRLPLALTWAPCIRLGRGGHRHSDENYESCVSTVDSACFVSNEELSDFHEACSEHHLLRGQGIVGRAFTTQKQCFATDITALSKTNYPLSHHARMFGLCAAVAIPLRSVYSGSIEFVLELFLPKDCHGSEPEKQMLNSLSSSLMQQVYRSLHVVLDKDLQEEVILPEEETVVGSEQRPNEIGVRFTTSPSSREDSSWIADMMEAQKKGKGVSVSLEYPKVEPKEEFKFITNWDETQQEIPRLRHVQQNKRTKSRLEGGCDSSSSGRKSNEKRRTKMDTISLKDLQQYFSGSLKDAAKSIGVCPTTLKRICRQHGISRWPSRKIKKVGHSLRKLQLVIDSVQGAEGAIQIESFYSSFPELSSPNLSGNDPFSPLKINDHPKPSDLQKAPGPKSPSFSCSQSSGSSTSCSTGAMQHSTILDALTAEDPGGVLKRAHSDVDMHSLAPEELKPLARSQSQKLFGNIEPLPLLPKRGGAFKVKACFEDVKVRFSLQTDWIFGDLQKEIAKRFNIDDISRFDLKYLDDEREWVLLTCDADLEECIDIYKSSQSHTIRISLHQASHARLGSSFGSTAPT